MERQVWPSSAAPSDNLSNPVNPNLGFFPALLPIPDGLFPFNRPPPIMPIIFADLGSDPSRNPRYKTEICRNFKERSRCIYGDQCQFAHGRRELRDFVRNNKYKTKLCQKYWVSGYCVYGPRCNFLHDEDKEMAEIAAQEHGLVDKKRDRSPTWTREVDANINKNPSPVNLYDVDNLESLDCLVLSRPTDPRSPSYFFETLEKLSPSQSRPTDASSPSFFYEGPKTLTPVQNLQVDHHPRCKTPEPQTPTQNLPKDPPNPSLCFEPLTPTQDMDASTKSEDS